jgi:hypothetical protein
MGLFDKLFGRQSKQQAPGKNSALKQLPTLEEFPALDAGERMGIIMTLGDSGRPDFFPFLKYAVQTDPDLHVKLAALKRIHLFKDHPDTAAVLSEMKGAESGENLEPYFSMALSSLGIISLKEFEDKINNTK